MQGSKEESSAQGSGLAAILKTVIVAQELAKTALAERASELWLKNTDRIYIKQTPTPFSCLSTRQALGLAKERLGASGVQLGRKVVVDGQEIVEFIAASEGREDMVGQVLNARLPRDRVLYVCV